MYSYKQARRKISSRERDTRAWLENCPDVRDHAEQTLLNVAHGDPESAGLFDVADSLITLGQWEGARALTLGTDEQEVEESSEILSQSLGYISVGLGLLAGPGFGERPSVFRDARLLLHTDVAASMVFASLDSEVTDRASWYAKFVQSCLSSARRGERAYFAQFSVSAWEASVGSAPSERGLGPYTAIVEALGEPAPNGKELLAELDKLADYHIRHWTLDDEHLEEPFKSPPFDLWAAELGYLQRRLGVRWDHPIQMAPLVVRNAPVPKLTELAERVSRVYS